MKAFSFLGLNEYLVSLKIAFTESTFFVLKDHLTREPSGAFMFPMFLKVSEGNFV